MKVSLLPENITSYLPLINKVLPTRSHVPILSNVLLDASSDGFYIRATDLEMGVEIKIPAKIETQGAITVPGKEFIEAISSLPKDKIEIELIKDIVTLTCRENKISFNTISQEEFPQLYKEKGVLVEEFSREEFVDIFSHLTFSVSTEDSRPQLTGVLIESKGEGVNFVSTDGYRMSIKKTKSQNKKISEGLIVSVDLVNEVVALKTGEKVALFINKEENQIIFEVGDALILGRMIDGKFPDYEKVLPVGFKTTVSFGREDLLQNVRLISVFAKDASNIATLEIEGNNMKLNTRAQGVGEGEAVVECQKKGEDNKISFNIKYLMDVLKALPVDRMELKLNSSIEPAVFEIPEKDFIHVIMPIQVEG